MTSTVSTSARRSTATEVRAWIDGWDDTVCAQLERRASNRQRERGDVVSAARLDRRLGWMLSVEARRAFTDLT
jgi:hypothetical protein